MLTRINELKQLSADFNKSEPLSIDSFEFGEELGSGGFGKVFQVNHTLTKGKYALKVLAKSQIEDLRLVDQLESEIKILARCNHPNIIKLFSAFEDKDYVYLCMELATDNTLYFKLKESKTFTEQQTADFMTDVIRAIHYLHNMQPPIIHRDIKPENILIVNGVLKIADFGWSNVNNSIRNTFCGTPDYLAPEMILGSGHTEKLDIWTLGVLMYEMLHGKPPFSPNEININRRLVQREIEKNIMQGKVEFDRNISLEAQIAIMKMLNPIDNLRPFAKDLYDLEFFIKYNKTLIPSKNLNINSNFRNNFEFPSKEILKEYERKIEILTANNKRLTEHCDQKDKFIAEKLRNFDVLKMNLSQSVR